MSDLPDGFVARQLRPSDAGDAYAVYAADEVADAGTLAIELEDIEADWARPSFDLPQDAIGIEDRNGQLVAAAEVTRRGTRAEGAVRPDVRALGLGTWLLGWIGRRARVMGATSVGQSIPAGSAADSLLAAHGHEVDYHAWVLQFPTATELPDAPTPAGTTLETAGDDETRHTAYEVIEEAFSAWPGRTPTTYEDWAATSIHRPGTQEWQLRVARDTQGAVIGACFTILDTQGTGYVDQVAVRAAHRGRGVGAALVVDGFRQAVSRGASLCELSTDSRTGALGLYQRLGMTVTQDWVHRRLPL